MENVFKSGFVTLVGRPNVGKSTLMNRLIGQKIAITSSKPQTTRKRMQTVYTDERGQIIFLDTPGIHKAKNLLGEYMVDAAEGTLKEADLILWLVEPTDFVGAGEQHILEQFAAVNRPVILVMNKCDTVEKETLARCLEVYGKLYPFAQMVPVSALKGKNTDTLLDVLFSYLKEGPRYYDDETVTEVPMRELAAEIIREKALRCLSDEIPHGIAVTVEKFHERRDGITDIEATIVCERESHKGIIIGKGGGMLKKIGSSARTDIEKMLDGQVNLKLWVKVRREWRDNELFMKSYGYDPSANGKKQARDF